MAMARRGMLAGGAAALVGAATAKASAPSASLERLQAKLKGRLVLPTDPDFNGLRRVRSNNPETDRRPAAIARCAGADDVARTIAFARRSGHDLTVRAGGHDVLGASVCEAGLLIDLANLTSVAIDPRGRTARVGAGVLSGAFNVTAGAHGLAPVLGCNPAVGVAGLTLGGGIGWMLGVHGAACDHLLGAEIVTADGAVRRVDHERDPDLFWAIRGGGGNFGVVTSLDFGLVPLGEVLGGGIAFDGAAPGSIGSFLRFYRDFMASAADALTVELNIFVLDRPIIVALVCWTGASAAGAASLAPLRDYARPAFDGIRPVTYARLTDQSGAHAPPPFLFWRGASLDALDDAAADTLDAIARDAPPGWSIGLGHVMRGQITRVADHATAFVRRGGQMTYFIGAGWDDPAVGAPRMAWVRQAMAKMAPLSSSSTYVNYLGDDSEAAVRRAYGANYERLRQVKRRYDPENIFRHNRNIRP